MLSTLVYYSINFGFAPLPISNRTHKDLFHLTLTNMDPRKKQDNKKPNFPPKQRLETLIRLRDEPHSLKNGRANAYDQDWFIGAVLQDNLETTYMNEISVNNLV